jgi:PAS domain S-box-containing protein
MEAAQSFAMRPDTFQLIFDSTPGLYLVLLPDAPRFTIMDANTAYTRVTLTSKDRLIGRGLFEAFPDNPNDPTANGVRNLTASLMEVLRTREPHKIGIQKYDVPIRDTDRFEEKYWSPLNTPVLNDKGEIIYILHAVLDVTDTVMLEKMNRFLDEADIDGQKIKTEELEKKVRERTLELAIKNEDLLKQKEFVEVILDSSLILVSAFDRDLRLIAFNTKSEQVFGIKKEEVIGCLYTDVFPGVAGSLTYNSVVRALKGEVIHNSQYRSTVNGRFYESYFVPLRDNEGTIYAVLMTAHDITDIVESAEKLQTANEELTRTNQELEQFAYIASHDLQEPLRKIQTFIGLLQNNLHDPNQLNRYAEKIHMAAGRMSALIKDVLNYSGVSGRAEPPVPVDLNEVIENIRNDFELTIAEKNAVIYYDPLPTVMGIPTQLHQLFANLMSNALKFSGNDTRITIGARILPANELQQLPQADPTKTYYEIIFSDNGIGFEQQYAEKIFGIFQRLENRGSYSGTGIGLALCKKIVENHGGFITASSEPGQGARFFIYLPAETE